MVKAINTDAERALADYRAARKSEPPRVHQVKSWMQFWDAINDMRKTHDLRKNDRDYRVGDYMSLVRWDQFSGRATGEDQLVKITFITDNKVPCAFSSSALHRDYSILSIQRVHLRWEIKRIRDAVHAHGFLEPLSS